MDSDFNPIESIGNYVEILSGDDPIEAEENIKENMRNAVPKEYRNKVVWIRNDNQLEAKSTIGWKYKP